MKCNVCQTNVSRTEVGDQVEIIVSPPQSILSSLYIETVESLLAKAKCPFCPTGKLENTKVYTFKLLKKNGTLEPLFLAEAATEQKAKELIAQKYGDSLLTEYDWVLLPTK